MFDERPTRVPHPVHASETRPETDHDLIVIGGGVQGVMTALVAAETGLRVLLLERDRFGSGVSGAWFQILHGGLRYLQKLDVGRLRASSEERRWFMTTFPDFVKPARFLMPLYDIGAKRPSVFRLAFAADAALTIDRNRGLAEGAQIPRGRVLDAADVVARYPCVRRDRLSGGALWTEAVAPDGDQLFQALLDRARRAGATAIEGAEALDLLAADDKVAGLRARIRATGEVAEFTSPRVINACGPDAGALARRLDPDLGRPLFHAALGFNLLLNRAPPSADGLALSPPGRSGAMLFLQPRGDQTFAGTSYATRPAGDGGDASDPTPSESEIEAFLQTLNAAAPGLEATRKDVSAITAGLLPATEAASVDLSDRDLVHDHGAQGGPAGLFTIVGVKFTTARRLAKRALALI